MLTPKFVSLEPFVLDERRVTLNLVTTDFPPTANINLNFEQESTVNPNKALLDSLFPNVELYILDEQGNEIASTFIVEHQEKVISFTLYLAYSKPDSNYLACADMLSQDKVIDRIRTSFILETQEENPPPS